MAPQMVPKWLLEASGALLGANWAPGASPGGSQDAPGGPRGRKKIHCYLPGGLRRNFPARFHPPRGSRGALWAPFWEALGLILALRLATGVENAKMSIFANTPHENLDFEGSGGLPGTIFGAKNRSKNKLEAKTARTHVPEPPKSLPERSWRPSGGEKKTLVTSKSGLEEFPSHLLPPSKLTPPPAGGGHLVQRPLVLEHFS